MPTFCYFLRLISTLDVFLKMFSTPACSWFWSSILSTEEKELPSIFSAERYFPDSISPLQKLLTDVTAKYFDERFHLRMSSV